MLCFVLYTLFVFIMRIADTFGEKAKSKCQHHLTSRRNETTPLQSRRWRWRQRWRWRRRGSQAAAALSSALTQHEIQICTECCDVPFRGQTEVRSMSLSPSLSASPSLSPSPSPSPNPSFASSGSSIVAPLQVAVAVAVCGFVFHF